MTKAQQKAAEVAARQWAAYQKKLFTLVGPIVAAKLATDMETVRAAFDNDTAAEAFAAVAVAEEPVGKAVFALKAAAVQRASDTARKIAENVREQLEAGGWDIKQVAPRPRSNDYSYSGQVAREKHSRFSRFTKQPVYKHVRDDEPYIVVIDESAVDRFIAQCEKDAAYQYDLFVIKLVNKVGPAVSAVLAGNHVWEYSFLTVTSPEGTVSEWKTQQIVNQSKLGLLFNQWPTRKVK